MSDWERLCKLRENGPTGRHRRRGAGGAGRERRPAPPRLAGPAGRADSGRCPRPGARGRTYRRGAASIRIRAVRNARIRAARDAPGRELVLGRGRLLRSPGGPGTDRGSAAAGRSRSSPGDVRRAPVRRSAPDPDPLAARQRGRGRGRRGGGDRRVGAFPRRPPTAVGIGGARRSGFRPHGGESEPAQGSGTQSDAHNETISSPSGDAAADSSQPRRREGQTHPRAGHAPDSPRVTGDPLTRRARPSDHPGRHADHTRVDPGRPRVRSDTRPDDDRAGDRRPLVADRVAQLRRGIVGRRIVGQRIDRPRDPSADARSRRLPGAGQLTRRMKARP